MAGSTWRFISCHVMAGSTWRFVSCHVMAVCNHRFISCHGVVRPGLPTVYDGYINGTMLIFLIWYNYFNTYGYGACHGYLLHGGYTCFMIDFMLCAVQIIVFLTLCRLNC